MPTTRPIEVIPPLRLPSNEIRLCSTADQQHESAHVSRWAAAFVSQGLCRSTIAINTYYPELSGGYYRNLALVRLMQDAWRTLGCNLIWSETFSAAHPCPDEGDGLLQDDEEYIVLRQGQVVGRLLTWHFSAGGGGDFLSDAPVFDLVSSGDLSVAMFVQLENLCRQRGVRVCRS